MTNNDTKSNSDIFREAMDALKKVDIHSVSESAHAEKNHIQSYEDVEIESEFLPHETIEYSKPGIQHKQLLQLKKGKIPISASIDLHEKNRIEARELLVHCIYNAQQNHHKCIKIVHGKGNSTPENIYPIMKNYTYSLLKKHQEVLAFCSAKYNDGGTGAVYVLLKKGKEHD